MIKFARKTYTYRNMSKHSTFDSEKSITNERQKRAVNNILEFILISERFPYRIDYVQQQNLGLSLYRLICGNTLVNTYTTINYMVTKHEYF